MESINVTTNPMSKDLFLRGRINVMSCQSCLTATPIPFPFMYTDTIKKLCIEYLPRDLFFHDESLKVLRERLTHRNLLRIQDNITDSYLVVPVTVYAADRLNEIISLWDAGTYPVPEAITHAAIDLLIKHLPAFEGKGRSFPGGAPERGGACDDDVREFFSSASSPCWLDHEWDAAVAAVLVARNDFIPQADLRFVKMLLTYCYRNEAQGKEHNLSMLRSGKTVSLLRRLKELRDTVPHWAV